MRLLFVKGEEGQVRIGMAVGKRQGKSHERNRGRRMLKEGFRRLLPWMRGDFMIVAGLTSAGMRSGSREIYEELASLLQKGGLLLPRWPGPNWNDPSKGVDKV